MADHPEAADSSSPHSSPPPMRFQLTEEEKSVLLECRKNSIARGFPAGLGACLFLRWLIRIDRVPLHVQRWQWFYYAGVFMVTFLTGVGSYKQRCIDKIMALENSQLAEQVRARRSGTQDWSEATATPPEPHPARHRRYPPRNRPSHTPSLSSKGEGYRQRKAAEPVYQQTDQDSNDITNQPDAFSGSSDPTPAQPSQRGRSPFEATPTRPKSRTFDEIRDENRQRQLPQSYPRSRKGERETHTEQDRKQPGSGKPVRRNKYGDIIEE